MYTMHFSSFWLFARLTNKEGWVACLLGPSTRNGLLVLNLLLDVDAGREAYVMFLVCFRVFCIIKGRDLCWIFVIVLTRLHHICLLQPSLIRNRLYFLAWVQIGGQQGNESVGQKVRSEFDNEFQLLSFPATRTCPPDVAQI